MGRKRRIEYPGAIYYISAECKGRDLFSEEPFCESFLEHLALMCERFHVRVHAYGLCRDSYQLILTTSQANLVRALQWFGALFTRSVNRMQGSTGTVFKGRYRSILLEDYRQALELSCYVHKKPLHEGLAPAPEQFPWSSIGCYLGSLSLPAWLDLEPLLAQSGGKGFKKAYQALLDSSEWRWDGIQLNLHDGMALGSEAFASHIKNAYLNGGTGEKETAAPAGAVIERVLQVLGVSRRDLVRMGGKGKRGLLGRDLAILWLYRSGSFKNVDIGELFGVSPSAVSRRVSTLKKRVAEEPALAEAWTRFCDRMEGEASRQSAVSEKSDLLNGGRNMMKPDGDVPSGNLHQHKSRQMKERLISATLDCLETYGYHKSSLAVILNHAGVTKGAWQYHFKSKSDLVAAAAEEMFNRSSQQFYRAAEALDTTDEASLPGMFDYIWRTAHQGAHRNIWLEFMVASRTDEELTRRITPVLERLAQITDEMARRFLESANPDLASAEELLGLTMNLTRGMAVQTIIHNDPTYYKTLRNIWYKLVSPHLKLRKKS